jgi:hypothetical protein
VRRQKRKEETLDDNTVAAQDALAGHVASYYGAALTVIAAISRPWSLTPFMQLAVYSVQYRPPKNGIL